MPVVKCKRCGALFEIKTSYCLSFRLTNDRRVTYCQVNIYCPACDARYVKILEGEDVKPELRRLGLW